MTTSVEAPSGLLRTLIAMADTLVADFDLPDFFQNLVERAADLFGAESAGLLMTGERVGIDLVAYTPESIGFVELLQLQVEQGPCLDAIRTRTPVRAADLAADADRWPRWSPRALDAGVRSVYATPMRLRDRTLGALNLFSARPDALTDADLVGVQALTDVATIGLLHERNARDQDVLSRQLQVALTSRVVLEQAKGVIAGRSTLDPERAFTALRAYCRNTNSKLGPTARAVIAGDLDVAVVLAPTT